MKFSNSALIGYNGLIGSNIKTRYEFDFLYNSKNIEDIRGKNIKTIVCAAPSGWKWKVNQEPEKDLEKIKNLFHLLSSTKCEKFILISTIDAIAFKEEWFPPPKDIVSYGGNRYTFENLLKTRFKEKLTIIRVPGLFGHGLKKNIIYDLLNGVGEYTYLNSQYQWLDIEYIVDFLNKELLHEIYELYPEPLHTKELVVDFFPSQIKKCRDIDGVYYNFKPKGGYCMTKKEVKSRMSRYIKSCLKNKRSK